MRFMEGKKYWNQADTRGITIPIHLSLLFTIQQIVMILHADEFGPAMLLCYELHLRKLRGPHAARTDVADFPRLDEIV
jgi:hypothetical protein